MPKFYTQCILSDGIQAFQKHIEKFYASEEFQKKAKDAEPFFNGVRDFVFGKALTLQNIVRIGQLGTSNAH